MSILMLETDNPIEDVMYPANPVRNKLRKYATRNLGKDLNSYFLSKTVTRA